MVDFASDLDPALPATRAIAAQPWTIRAASGPAFQARWTPGPQDVTLAIGLMDAANSERFVVGPTPAHVVTTGVAFEPKILVAGRTVSLRVEVVNTGGSSARNVVVTTRSSLAALHKQRFSFGHLRPNKRKSQTTQVAIPADVPGDSVTVVVSVDAAEGHGPEITQTLKVATSGGCPEGRFSRARYEAKRAKLLKAVSDGSMTQAEFESYDAELVRCLD
jgi:hypothetical protein